MALRRRNRHAAIGVAVAVTVATSVAMSAYERHRATLGAGRQARAYQAARDASRQPPSDVSGACDGFGASYLI